MDITIIEKLVLVFVLTSLYGLDRQRTHKPVGFGTFILVAIGACGLTIVANNLGLIIALPLLGAIVTGIGFLGAGALVRNSDRTFGFTTAASVWLFAIFGVIIGLGMYDIGLVIYVLVWVVVIVDRNLEKRLIGSYRRELAVITQGFVDKKEVTDILGKYCSSFKLIKAEVKRKEKEVQLKYLIEGLKKDIESLLKEFYEKKWCISIELN